MICALYDLFREYCGRLFAGSRNVTSYSDEVALLDIDLERQKGVGFEKFLVEDLPYPSDQSLSLSAPMQMLLSPSIYSDHETTPMCRLPLDARRIVY